MAKSRSLIVLLVGALMAMVPGLGTIAQARELPADVRFDLNARVLDGGEQVVAVTLDTSGLGRVDARSLSVDSFTVHAKGVSPVPVVAPEAIYSEYDADRVITGVSVRNGDIVIELASGFGVPAANTLGYLAVAARNVMLDLTYTITQNEPVTLMNGRSISLGSFEQGDLLDPEVDAFTYGQWDGMNYRLATPKGNRPANRPLVVWLHGNGEGGVSADEYNNESQLRANRGALGPATTEAQRILGGAYVLAPQVPDTWYNIDAAGYDATLKAMIDDVVRTYRIDASRIYLMGASAGGFMTVRTAGAYPQFFAAAVPTAPALFLTRTQEYTATADQVLLLKDTPTWLVHAQNDPTVPFDKASQWAYDLLAPSGNVLISLYDNVVWDGVTFNGHWSWIYTAHNDPSTPDGQHLWQWMAEQTR